MMEICSVIKDVSSRIEDWIESGKDVNDQYVNNQIIYLIEQLNRLSKKNKLLVDRSMHNC